MERRITGATRLLGLFGSPVSHSGSPAMYNYSFEKLGLDYAYLAFDVTEENLPEAIAAAKVLKMKGFNLTMPCKTAALRFMDELSPAAELIGAVNTVVVENGRMTGHNTDGLGFVRNLKDHGIDIQNRKMTILGGGGAATAIQVQAALDGAGEISIFNARDRFYESVETVAGKVSKAVPGCRIHVYDLADQDRLCDEIASSDILVNATRVGMKPMDGESLIKDFRVFRRELAVADVVYSPRETKMILDARKSGCEKTIGGIGMLLWQGVEAFRLYTGMEMPVDEVRRLFFS